MKPDEIRIASVYFFQGRALVHALGRTVKGAWIPVGPIEVLPAESLGDVATALLAALSLSRQGLPQPGDWAAVMEPLLKASGAPKWPDFLKGAACLGVEQRDAGLSVVPTRNLGEEGGYEPMLTEAIRPDRPDATGLAKSIGEAFQRCN